MRNLTISVKNGQITFNKALLAEALTTEDGDYYIELHSLSKMTPRGCQRSYFLMLESITAHSGYSKTELHEMFKSEKDIETTSGLDIKEWIEVLNKLRMWAYEKLEVIL